MAFALPTLNELRQRTRGLFAARLPGADMTLRRSNLGVLADIIAAMLWSAWAYMVKVAENLMPDQAEIAYLERWCRIYGIARRGVTRARAAARERRNTVPARFLTPSEPVRKG